MTSSQQQELVFGAGPGEVIGTSEWVRIDQSMIDRFADATLDPDPMHIDPSWAKANSPFGGTVAFGFLTVSLLTHLFWSATAKRREGDPAAHYVNYGFDRLRLVAPVPTGSRVRGHFKSLGVSRTRDGIGTIRIGCQIEIEGHERPALVAEWIAARIEQGVKRVPEAAS